MKAKILALVLALCLVAGLLAGCAGNSETSSNVSTSASPSASGAQESAKPTENTETKNYGGDITLVLGMRPSFFLPKVSGKGTQMLICPAIESIGRQENDGTWSPFLAESWKEDAAAKTFTITLRQGIKFHDGSELNADVLMWNFDMMLEAGRKTDLSSVTSYEKTDDYTVVMHFDAYSNAWIETIGMARIVSKAAYEKNGEEYMKTNAIGTGAFVQDEYVQGTSIKFIKNENYWQEGLPYLDSITMIQISDQNTQIAAVSNGEVQGLDVRTGTLKTQIEAVGFENVGEQNGATASITYIQGQFRDENNPFSDVRVRQAVMYALDRDATAAAISEGFAQGTNQVVAKGSYAYLDNPKYDYAYSIEKAKALLTEAGYPNGFETVIETTSSWEKYSVALQSSLEAVGIKASIDMQDSSTATEIGLKGDFKGLTASGGSVASINPINFLDRGFGPNKTRFFNAYPDEYPVLSNLLITTPTLTSLDEQKKACQQVGELMNELLPLLPWMETFSTYYADPNLKDTNYYTIQAWQWTPEIAYLEK